ncbi:hypothetical protein [Robiginitalea sp.]|jgi:hypothetical protein|uniref:hypothetical protein n=1 Tax=Robiginitalea sp. TaxID=1902411 RepID=UPI003C756FCD
MAPVSGQDGFKLPKGYFENFPERIAKRTAETNPVGEKPMGGFRTPDMYFETFGERIQERLSKKDVRVRRLRPLQMIWIPAVAAAILLLLVWSPSSPSPALEFEDINAEVLQAYLQTEEFDVTPGELAENLPLMDLAMEDVLDRAPEARVIADYLEDYIESDQELYLDSNE